MSEPSAEKPVTPEKNQPKTGKFLDFLNRLKQVQENPTVQESLRAMGRTFANLGISAADLIPGVGEIVEATVIGKKLMEKHKKTSGKTGLSPDVPLWATILPNTLEIPFLGAFPSYIITTLIQLRSDIPRIKEGFSTARAILHKEQQDYRENKDRIDQAVNTFSQQ